MEPVRATPRQMMREIYRQEAGIPERVITMYLKCEQLGLVDHEEHQSVPGDMSREIHARKLFHQGVTSGWIY